MEILVGTATFRAQIVINIEIHETMIFIQLCVGFQDLVIDGRIILKWIKKKQGERVWTGLIWIRARSTDGDCEHVKNYFYLSMPLQSFVGPWPLFYFLNLIHSR
jgi:hypothetical protein